MPELPEVETIRRGLAEKLVGHKILSVDVRAPKLFIGDAKLLRGQIVIEMERRAKLLIWKLSDGFLLTHLKMTGQLIFQPKNGPMVISERTPLENSTVNDGLVIGGHPDKAYGLDLPHKHTHILIELDNGTLFFNDLRKFGWLKYVHSPSDLKVEVAKYGPEYTWPEFSLEYFKSGLAKRRITVKQALLDQTFIAGIGNIYADESLFCAKIDPRRKANELTNSEIKKLFACVPEVFNLSLSHGGTSSQHYRQVDGKMGTYLDVANVYKREGQPCRVCGTPIKRIKITGRSSHFCPHCQS